MAKGFVVFDLTAMLGSARLRFSGPALPRYDKRALELMLANRLFTALKSNESLVVQNEISNPNDPPDVLFSLVGEESGLEVAELVPDNRLERDAIIQKIRANILAGLQIGPKTRDSVVTVSFNDDYAHRLRPKFVDSLIELLRNHFDTSSSETKTKTISLPTGLQSSIRRISVET